MTNLCKNAAGTECNHLIRPLHDAPTPSMPTQPPSDIQDLIAHSRRLVYGREPTEKTGSEGKESFLDMTLQTVIDEYTRSPELYYMPLVDLPGARHGVHPSRPYVLPADPLAQFYFASVGAIGLYMVYRFMEKAHI